MIVIQIQVGKMKERERNNDLTNKILLRLNITTIRLGKDKRNKRKSERKKRRNEQKSYKIFSSKNKLKNFKKDKKKEKHNDRNSFT